MLIFLSISEYENVNVKESGGGLGGRMRTRLVGHFCIIVDAPLSTVLSMARGISPAAILGTIASWSRKFCPVLFADTPEMAAKLCESFLLGVIRDTGKVTKALEQQVGLMT